MKKLRVYEIIMFNLKQIKFKENKDFLDALLEKYGYKYKSIAFDFGSCEEKDIKKVTKSFPPLEKYAAFTATEKNSDYEQHIFSSIRKNEHGEEVIHADNEDIEAFSGLLKKIPNPINFGTMEVLLDGIDWYSDNSLHSMGKPHHGFFAFAKFYSNSITFKKQFDYGNKLNLITFTIDRTLSDEELRPHPEAFEKLIAELGKPYHKCLECAFEEDEKKAWTEAREPLQKRIRNEDLSKFFTSYESELQERAKKDLYTQTLEELTPISGFSPKKGFSKAAKKFGFKYKTFNSQCYFYTKTNENNHTVTAEFFNNSFSSSISGAVDFNGYNISHGGSNGIPQVLIYCEKDAENYAEKLFEAALALEKIYKDELLSTYGKTPIWYKQ